MLITQNVDGLHQAAGQQTVIEVHGNLREARCISCAHSYPSQVLDVDVQTRGDIPRCSCGGMLKPGVVLFEESLLAAAVERAFAEARSADLFVVVGSSLQVGPVNLLPRVALERAAKLAITNLEPTHMDSVAYGWQLSLQS